jgi:hypothetical protein
MSACIGAAVLSRNGPAWDVGEPELQGMHGVEPTFEDTFVSLALPDAWAKSREDVESVSLRSRAARDLALTRILQSQCRSTFTVQSHYIEDF